MKRILLLILCALPCVLMGQSVEPTNRELKKLPPLNIRRMFTGVSSSGEDHQPAANTLDSVINKESRVDDMKRIFGYDEKGNAIVETIFESDKRTGRWMQYQKNEIAYNADNLPSSITVYQWDRRLWIPQQKRETSYNSSGKDSLSVDYMWNRITNDWQKILQNKTTYDINGNPVSATRFAWDNENSVWKVEEHKETCYDSSDNIIMEISSIYDGNSNSIESAYKQQTAFCPPNFVTKVDYSWSNRLNDWVKEKYAKQVRNRKNYLTPVQMMTWDTLTNQCTDSTKYDLTIDSQGNATLALGYLFDEGRNTWKQFQKYVYQYDTNNNLISIESYWRDEGSDWEGNFKTTYSFDGNDRKTSEAHYDWDKLSAKWINGIKNEYTYTKSGQILANNAFVWQENKWAIDYTETYYYREK